MSTPLTSFPESEDVLDDALATAISGQMCALPQWTAAAKRDLFSRIESAVGFEPAHRFLPAQGGEWRVLADRVFLKVLERDEQTGQAKYLVRYSPGTSFPRHPQRSVEECLLITGDLRIGEDVMQPGDLQIAVPGLEHGPLISEHGALVFVRGVLGKVPTQLAGDEGILF
jgi:hypothetical protein